MVQLFPESDLHVQQLEDPGVVERKDPLENKHVGRVNRGGLWLPLMLLERVDRNLRLPAVPGEFQLRYPSITGSRLSPTNPFFKSRSFSTRISKSIDSGASKSYSFANAFLDCSGVKDL